MTPGQAKALLAAIQENVNYLIANCKLPPKADATLHVLIGDLLSGASLLMENPASADGIARITSALRRYPHEFSPTGPRRFFLRVNSRFAFVIDEQYTPTWWQPTNVLSAPTNPQ